MKELCAQVGYAEGGESLTVFDCEPDGEDTLLPNLCIHVAMVVLLSQKGYSQAARPYIPSLNTRLFFKKKSLGGLLTPLSPFFPTLARVSL